MLLDFVRLREEVRSPVKSTISRTFLATVSVQPILCVSTLGRADLIPSQSTKTPHALQHNLKKKRSAIFSATAEEGITGCSEN